MKHRIEQALINAQIPRSWVVYRWYRSRWNLVGFVRYPHLSKRRLARIRNKFSIPMREVMEVMELFEAAKTGGPQYAPDTRLRKPEQPLRVHTPYLRDGLRRTVRSQSGLIEIPKIRFIALGERIARAGQIVSTYLGHIVANSIAEAKREAARLFKGLYGSAIRVCDIKQLDKRLRSRIRRRLRKGKLIAGVTTLVLS